ncbi:MAG: SH3 domain-containing protein [Bacteroidales bacterium]|nr:SH3 domain-containing protein [Bacteroidales bacterium]
MKKIILIISVLSNTVVFGQYTLKQIDRKIDSLQTAKLNTEQRIIAYQEQLKQINKELTDWQAKKKQLIAETTGDVIMAKTGEGGAVLRDKPSALGTAIVNIPPNTPIKVFKEYENLYLKVEYNGQTGYVNYSTIAANQEIDDFLSGKSNSNQVPKNSTQTYIVRSVDESNPRFQKLQKLYGRDNAIRIMNKEVWEGMSIGQVIESIGQPQNKSSINTDQGIKEIWEYSQYTLEFFNGAVAKVIKK